MHGLSSIVHYLCTQWSSSNRELSRLLEMLPKTNVRYVPDARTKNSDTHAKTGNYSVAGIQTRTHPNTWHCRACTINHTSSLLLWCPHSTIFTILPRMRGCYYFISVHTHKHTHAFALSFSLILVLLYYLCVACRRVAMCCVLDMRTKTDAQIYSVEGGELFDRVIDDEFVLTERACAVFVRQVCQAMEFVHRNNIIHLDLKPENILCLTREGNRIKIIDFGLARRFDPDKKLQVGFGRTDVHVRFVRFVG